jgi:hypothetical protein
MSNNYLDMFYHALSYQSSYDYPAIASNGNILIRDSLDYRTLDEDFVIKERIKQYEDMKKTRGWMLKLGGLILGAAVGVFGSDNNFSDGLSLGEITEFASISSAGLTAGGIGAHILETLDDKQLKELDLLWLKEEYTYTFHLHRHTKAVKRLLIIFLSPDYIRTQFAIQFGNGYVGYLSPLPKVEKFLNKLTEIGASFNRDSFVMSGQGDTLEWVKNKSTLGYCIDNNEVEYPIELWDNGKNRAVAVVSYKRPLHSVY